MTGFDHRLEGTAEAAWRSGVLDVLPTVAASGERLVVLAAHPDDETLGAGGLVAASHRAGARIDVLVASDGEASHPVSPTRRPAELAAVRRREVRAAVAHLAPLATVHHLGLPDGGLDRCRTALVDALTAVLDGDTAVRLVSPWRGDRHPDHEACAAAASEVSSRRDAVEHWQYPIWWWHWGDPSAALPAGLHRLPLGADDVAAKRAAMREHVSQHSPLSAQLGDEAILPPPILAHFERRAEHFVVAGAPASRAAYFDALYERSPDPWGLQTRFYEQRKRDLVMASLPRARFARAFEPGCSIGLLTARLAERADQVVAWDTAPAALEQAASRLPSTVRLRRGRIPHEWPAGRFDLIVLSEVAYYCDDLGLLVRRVLDSLDADGVVIGCHWSRPAPDHPHTAADVHEALDASLVRVARHLEDDFRLDVWTRDGRSVATVEGIV